ncbi:MAG: T9SS type A sorting domain-containing protein [candidate division Zixibacteria bacterium]|nr:T9SS type A sorting domain-containing protein [candidate division Zixibacteria bacterium]
MTRLLMLLAAALIMIATSPLTANAAKEWTIMVYMGADNNLEPYAIDDLNEMEQVGSGADFNVVVQIDRAPGYDYSNGNWQTTRRYYVTKDSDNQTINSDLIADLGELNMGHPQTLTDFVDWATTNYPANKYFLILWDHGSGWHKNLVWGSGLVKIEGPPADSSEASNEAPFHISAATLPPATTFPGPPFAIGAFKAVCSDETNGSDMLFNDEVQSALTGLSHLDIIGFDACLMGMIEVAYEYKDQVDYMIASEENEPADGWPYHYILQDLVADPLMSAAAMCSVVVDAYALSMTGQAGDDQTLSGVDLSLLPLITTRLDSLCSLLRSEGVWSEMHTWLPTAEQVSDTDPFYDLYDIVHIAATKLTGANITAAANDLMNILDAAIVAEWHESGHPNAHGLSIYFPQSLQAYDINYHQSGIDFPNETGWYDFLKHYWQEEAPVQDVPEPNDLYSQAGLPLDTLFEYQSWIGSMKDVDYWLINSGIDETVEVFLDVPSDANFDMYLYNSHQILLTHSATTGGGVDEYISYHSSVPEYMYLKISSIMSSSTLPYILSTRQQGHHAGAFPISYDDGWPDGGYYDTTYGNVLGVSYDLPAYPMNVDRLWIYFYGLDGSGSGGDGSFYLLFYDNYGYVIDPMELGLLTPTVAGWNYLDLTADDVRIYSNFFVGIWYDGVNTPVIGYDDVFRGCDYSYDSATDQWSYLHESLFFRFDVSYPGSGVGVADEVREAMPTQFALRQNCPNPFNANTLIQYVLDRPAPVQFEVFNILGAKVYSENVGARTPGIYSVIWESKDNSGKTLPSGIYFYRLKAGDNVDTKKMLLLK